MKAILLKVALMLVGAGLGLIGFNAALGILGSGQHARLVPAQGPALVLEPEPAPQPEPSETTHHVYLPEYRPGDDEWASIVREAEDHARQERTSRAKLRAEDRRKKGRVDCESYVIGQTVYTSCW